MSHADAQGALRELGFNQLEAEVFVFLLSRPGLTAYAVGRAIGRPTANVYKAVESLARRGAVLVEEGEQRACKAVPVGELLKQLDHGFRASLQNVKVALADIEATHDDERVYRIESVDRLFEHCRDMLERARDVVVVDAFPRALQRILPWVSKACARGVKVYVEAYAPISVPAANVVIFPRGKETLATWKGEQLNLVVDGREHVLALLNPQLDEIRQAVWSNSLYLSCIHHAGRLAEHTLVGMVSLEADGDDGAAQRLLQKHPFFANSQVPGHVELMRRFGAPSTNAARRHPRRTK